VTSSPTRSALPLRRWDVRCADCLHGLAELPAASIDAVITDPPYGINFRGHAWDRPHTQPARRSTLTPARAFQAWCEGWAAECLRVLKPGGHLASFGSPRTAHRLASALEDSGFELRDVLMWLHGQGYPKSRNLTGNWHGWGTGLKPAYEPIILARKPLTSSVNANLAQHHVGALHIDACRSDQDRWPTNLLLDHHRGCTTERCTAGCPVRELGPRARFFYTAKASRRERDAGCEHLERRTIQTFKIGRHAEDKAAADGTLNIHPTVKPLALMRWLIRLLCPPAALVLDPFTGSGSTGCAAALEHVRFLGYERDPTYAEIAKARIDHHARQRPTRQHPRSTVCAEVCPTPTPRRQREPKRRPRRRPADTSPDNAPARHLPPRP
jgi:DNA modification methylase